MESKKCLSCGNIITRRKSESLNRWNNHKTHAGKCHYDYMKKNKLGFFGGFNGKV
jgi:hypothetical protein